MWSFNQNEQNIYLLFPTSSSSIVDLFAISLWAQRLIIALYFQTALRTLTPLLGKIQYPGTFAEYFYQNLPVYIRQSKGTNYLCTKFAHTQLVLACRLSKTADITEWHSDTRHRLHHRTHETLNHVSCISSNTTRARGGKPTVDTAAHVIISARHRKDTPENDICCCTSKTIKIQRENLYTQFNLLIETLARPGLALFQPDSCPLYCPVMT